MKFFKKLIKSIDKRIRYLTIRPITYPLFKGLYFFSLKGMGILNYENNKLSGEKYFISNLLKEIVGDKDEYVFLDVGANVGNYALLLLDSFPNANIFSFEPHPGNFSELNRHKKINACNIAVGDDNKDIKLFDFASSNGTELASIYHEVISEIHKKEVKSFTVTMKMLDNICSDENIEYIDFLKIDTEGNELFVLEGAKKLIENKAIKCIHFEFNEMNVISKVFMRDFINLLDGFELYRLLPKGMIKLEDSPILTEIFAFQNIIAIYK